MYWRSFLAIIGLTLLSQPAFANPIATPPPVLAREVGRFVWWLDMDHFGGFSGLELAPDGQGFATISDRSWYAQGKIQRDETGRIIGAQIDGMHQLKPPAGRKWQRGQADSEGLAFGPDGGIFVSFEGAHRVFRYADLGQDAQALPSHPGFAGLISNGSLEALAAAPDGTLYTLPERSGHQTRPFPIFRYRNGEWSQPFDLPRTDDFLPVGADFGPDGKLYLLERRFQLIRGFANRVRRFTVTEQGLTDPELIFEGRAGQYHNLEGVSVWRTPGGKIRLTMISDDNFNFLQATELVEFEITNELALP